MLNYIVTTMITKTTTNSYKARITIMLTTRAITATMRVEVVVIWKENIVVKSTTRIVIRWRQR